MWSPRWPENLVGQPTVEAEDEAEARGRRLPDVVVLELELGVVQEHQPLGWMLGGQERKLSWGLHKDKVLQRLRQHG